MPESPRLDHLYVNGYVESRPRTSRGMGKTTIRPVDRQTHGKRLIEEVEAAFAQAQEIRDSQLLDPTLQANGTYLTLEGVGTDFELKLDSLTTPPQITLPNEPPYGLPMNFDTNFSSFLKTTSLSATRTTTPRTMR